MNDHFFEVYNKLSPASLKLMLDLVEMYNFNHRYLELRLSCPVSDKKYKISNSITGHEATIHCIINDVCLFNFWIGLGTTHSEL